MKTSFTCQTCGAALTETNSGDAYCPACILRQGLLSSLSTQPALTPAEKPAPVFGSYELLEEIGRGGMGVVYKARQRSLKRTVAIKLLVSGAYSSESLLRRFQIEAESAAGLQHPGIVAIYEFGETDNQPFYAMEYVEGRNLSEVSGGQPLDPARAATYVKAIAEAVQYAHSRGILHRDLKPPNVLIDLDDRPRVTDFGLAKQMDGPSEMTVAGQMLGSPNYSAPEQAAGRQDEVGVASDVYSLGALLYHLLTGRPPFLASTMQETLRLVHETDPISPHLLNPNVPRDLDTICCKCLEKDPAKRYASAFDVASELKRFLNGEPIHARPVSSPERGWRWCRRHPALAALATTVVLALTATSVVFYTSARRIERARAEEHAARQEAEQNLYAASMQVTSRAFTTVTGGDPRALLKALEASRPRPGEPDNRGFEWRYFKQKLTSDALAELTGHHNVVDRAFYSPDGRLIVSHSLDGVAKVWTADPLRELHSIEQVDTAGGFLDQGRRLVFRRHDRSLWQCDTETGRITQLAARTGPLVGVAAGQVVLLDPQGIPVRHDPTDPIKPEVAADIPGKFCVTLSADGARAAVAMHGSPEIVVYDLADGRVLARLPDHRPVIALALAPDGSRVVSTSFDGVAKVWNVATGAQENTFRSFLDPIWGIAFSPDGRRFALGGNNRDVKILDTTNWNVVTRLVGHSTTVRSVDFSPDGSRVISTGEDERGMIWPAVVTRPVEEMSRLLRGPEYLDRTPSLAFAPDSGTFVGTAADGTVKLWRTDTAEVLATFPMEARSVAFSPDGRSVLGEAYNGTVRRWVLGTNDLTQTLNPNASFANWQVDSLTPEERVSFVADQAATRAECRLCEITSARDGIFAGAVTSAPTIAMSQDGATMFVGLPTGSIEVWDVASRRRLLTFAAHKLPVTALAVSPDGKFFATGSLDNSTRLWDAATGRLLASFYEHNRPVWALAFSPDGRTLATGSCDKEILLCSVPLRRHVASIPLYVGTPQGYEQEVRLLRFSPDGRILAAALGDGTLRFFRAAPETGRAAATIPPPL